MKILQVMPDFNLAGAQTMCENLIMELIKNKNDRVEVISFYNDITTITKRLEENGIIIHYLNKKKGLDYSIIKKIKKIIFEFEPDVIHTHRYALEYVMPALIRNKKVKIIHTVHNMAINEVPRFLQKLQYIWFRKETVIPVAISENVQKSIIERYKLAEDKVPIIYNGINLSKCIKKTNYDSFNKILHIGRFSEQKNHDELIDIFNECLREKSDLKLILVGEGEMQEKIEKKVKNLNIEGNVIFKGKISSPYEIMNSADMFVLTSKWEGMPMTLIEAMGTGLPCIAYPVGGIPNMIIDGETGFLPQNAEEFKKAILNLAKLSNNEIKKICEKTIKTSQKFSATEMRDKYYYLYSRNSRR